ncbi:UNVERIFIED_CONTAM: Cytochrome b561 [Trichonephila clavipes]
MLCSMLVSVFYQFIVNQVTVIDEYTRHGEVAEFCGYGQTGWDQLSVARTVYGQAKEKQKYVSSPTKTANIMYPRTGGNLKDMAFIVAVIASQIVGFIIVGLLIRWCFLYKGFSWEDANLQFNYHPLFMVLGLIYFYGDALIVYRVMYFLPKWVLKIIHACLHACAIIFSTIALVAVLENHRRTFKADFYSLHSWMGIATFSCFILQVN